MHTTIYIEIDTDPYNEMLASGPSISHSVDMAGKQFISTESQLRNREMEGGYFFRASLPVTIFRTLYLLMQVSPYSCLNLEHPATG